jgi:hypothetical protein
MFGCTDPVQVLLHMVCHCEDDQLSILSPCGAVLDVSQYGHYNLQFIALATSVVLVPPYSMPKVHSRR